MAKWRDLCPSNKVRSILVHVPKRELTAVDEKFDSFPPPEFLEAEERS
jgi:hypothetical protein